jgi:hypothetical protein
MNGRDPAGGYCGKIEDENQFHQFPQTALEAKP